MTIGTDLSMFTGKYTLDRPHTQMGFVARHAMVTKVRGTFDEFDGAAVFDAADPAAAKVTVTIQAASINTRNADRDAHLRSNDFLAMEDHPTITFVSTDLRRTGDTTFDLTGDLTIRGVTRSITIPFEFDGVATDPYGNVRLGFTGSLAINRSDFGVTWNAPLETGGFLVSDRIVLEFEVSAIKTG
jgi:polyisoprenoid-binding protein YceI